ncbi:MAG: hypothetical protein LUE27_05905, partial [Clostridia bacterium]|nr:hypothetical protein [Clostridia bacterium]
MENVAHEHTWDSGVSTATCIEDGTTIYTCTGCGMTVSVPVSALGHNYVITETTATCTESGSVTNTCT